MPRKGVRIGYQYQSPGKIKEFRVLSLLSAKVLYSLEEEESRRFRRGLFLSAVISLILLSVTNAQAAAVLWAVSQFDDRAAVQSFLPAGSTVS